jgi:hypothetical protein
MRLLLIAVVLIYGLKLDYAVFWYVAAGIVAAWDSYWFYTWNAAFDQNRIRNPLFDPRVLHVRVSGGTLDYVARVGSD